jgi:hypothetical protein
MKIATLTFMQFNKTNLKTYHMKRTFFILVFLYLLIISLTLSAH